MYVILFSNSCQQAIVLSSSEYSTYNPAVESTQTGLAKLGVQVSAKRFTADSSKDALIQFIQISGIQIVLIYDDQQLIDIMLAAKRLKMAKKNFAYFALDALNVLATKNVTVSSRFLSLSFCVRQTYVKILFDSMLHAAVW